MAETFDWPDPVEHALKMYDIFTTINHMSHEYSLKRALVIACEGERRRCLDSVEAAEGESACKRAIGNLPRVNIDPKTGMLY